MTIDRFEIILDHHQPFDSQHYRPGEQVKGYVLVHNTADTTYDDFFIELKGHAEALVSNDHHGLLYSNEEIYVHTKQHFNEEGEGAKELTQGEHHFQFHLALPEGIPSSYAGEYGKVEYVLKAHMKRSWIKHDQNHELPVIVRTEFDLNNTPGVWSEPPQTSMNKDHMLFRQGNIYASLTTDKTGYVPGETVYVTARIDNQSSSGIEKSTVELILRESCTSAHGRKVSEKVLQRVERGHIHHSETMLWDREPILIPQHLHPSGLPLPPTGLPNCNIIDVSYVIKLTVHPGRLTSDLVESVKIVLGTVALTTVTKN